jgi:hypothetical protein
MSWSRLPRREPREPGQERPRRHRFHLQFPAGVEQPAADDGGRRLVASQVLYAKAHVGLVVLGFGKVGPQRDQIGIIHVCCPQERPDVLPDDIALLLERYRHGFPVREIAVEAADEQQPRGSADLDRMAVAAVGRK